MPKYQIADASCFYDRYIKLDSSNTIEERYMKKTSMCEISDLTYRVKYYGRYTDSSGYYYIFTDEHKDSDDVYGVKFAKTDNDVSTCISIDVSTSVTYNSPDTSILHAFAKHYYDSSEGTLLDMTLVSYDTVSNTPYYSIPSIVKRCDSLNMYIIRLLFTNYYNDYSMLDVSIERCENNNYDYYLFPSWAIKVNNDSSNINNILYDSIFPYDCSIFDNNVMKLAFTDSSYYGYRSIRCKSLEDGSGLKTDASLYIDTDCSLYLLPKEWNYSSKVFNLDSATDMRKRNIYIEDSAVNRDYLYYVDGTNAVSCRDFDINYATSFVNTDGIMDVSLNVYQYNNTIRTHYDEVAVAVDVDGIIEYPSSYYQTYDITPRWKLYTHDNDTSRKLLIESFNKILAIKPLELSSYDIELAMFDSFLNKDFRNKIPKNDIFEINSLFFNIMKHKKEILNKYKCYLDEENNQFCLILDQSVCFSDFTKEIMLNLFDFSEKLGIDTICFLISKKNPQFVRIVQDLMIVGFKSNERNNETVIEGNTYKIMEIPVNINEKIEEFYF